MTESLKKSFAIVRDNPLITLTFVIYLIILFSVVRAALMGNNPLLVIILGILILLLTSAFFSGWFGMIKAAVLCFKENKTIEERVEDISTLKNKFFSSVSAYFMPITASLLILLLAVIALAYISNYMFYKLNDVINQINTLYMQQGAVTEYLTNLPEDTKIMVAKKMIFSILTTGFLQFISILYAASLYFNKKSSKNPFRAVFYTFGAIFSMPFISMLTFLVITFVYFSLTLIQTYFGDNLIVSFIAMILGIYFAAYIVVLIFDLYDNKITNNSNNRPDCIGENQPGN